MKRTSVLLIPISSNILFDETCEKIENLLGKLNIEFAEESLAFTTTLEINNEKKKIFQEEMHDLNLDTLFIEGNEDLIDKICTENTLNLENCSLNERIR